MNFTLKCLIFEVFKIIFFDNIVKHSNKIKKIVHRNRKKIKISLLVNNQTTAVFQIDRFIQ